MLLPQRGLLLVKGARSTEFLQGLVTKDMESLNTEKLIYTYLLNVRGRIFTDMFIWRLSTLELGERAYAIETDFKRQEGLLNILKKYKLRKPIQIEPLSDKQVHFCVNLTQQSEKQFNQSNNDASWFSDPRVSGLGYRTLQPCNSTNDDYDSSQDRHAYLEHRLRWGIAEGEDLFDLIPLNANGDFMNAISFDKGCYIGQELVARTYHTGVIRRRIMPFRWKNPNTAPLELSLLTESKGQTNKEEKFSTDDPLILRDEKQRRQGKIIRSFGEFGICLVSVETVPENTIVNLYDPNGHIVMVYRPKWWPKQ